MYPDLPGASKQSPKGVPKKSETQKARENIKEREIEQKKEKTIT